MNAQVNEPAFNYMECLIAGAIRHTKSLDVSKLQQFLSDVVQIDPLDHDLATSIYSRSYMVEAIIAFLLQNQYIDNDGNILDSALSEQLDQCFIQQQPVELYSTIVHNNDTVEDISHLVHMDHLLAEVLALSFISDPDCEFNQTDNMQVHVDRFVNMDSNEVITIRITDALYYVVSKCKTLLQQQANSMLTAVPTNTKVH